MVNGQSEPAEAAVGEPPDHTGAPLVTLDSAVFKHVQVALHVRLGAVVLTIEDLLALKSGGVLTLESRINDLVELCLDDQVVARGEIVAVGDRFGVRIAEIALRT